MVLPVRSSRWHLSICVFLMVSQTNRRTKEIERNSKIYGLLSCKSCFFILCCLESIRSAHGKGGEIACRSTAANSMEESRRKIVPTRFSKVLRAQDIVNIGENGIVFVHLICILQTGTCS